jgi:nicotinamidase-related amidase
MQMTYEPLSPETTALLLVDHQTRVLEWVVKAAPREEVEANVLRLARAAAQLEMPLIFTTSEEGQNGTLLPAEPRSAASHRRCTRTGMATV